MPWQTILNTLIANMMKTKIFFVLFLVILCCVWLAFGNVFTLNFIFAFLSFLLIALGVFYTQKRKILKLLNGASKEELETLVKAYKSKQEKQDEEQEEFFLDDSKSNSNFLKDSIELNEKNSQNTQEVPLKKRKFLDNFSAINIKTGTKIFFFPLRLLTYGILIIGILILIHHEIFNTLAFFSGLVFANLVLILGITFGI
ncbi:hypothetical protein [Helicobacter winghamensis]|uniref:hypothetical protein n=1 Tax=Helicobacter winghamensis TaxID=157268 RepID=UPI0018A5451F|nr:hypothetical protein [Helicobacter winghamensis]QOQ98644.1 hypothetical protein A0Z60_03520 [Helicobacter winghamensis]